ncbi:hypothetical protein [Streptomyces sp. AF1A]|jgi:hypothetical protein|uniref:hypothetical protein n=1 Tax=Streptomyces sp. AF1A TaxID=3394350 RepID=UPI0039BD71BA
MDRDTFEGRGPRLVPPAEVSPGAATSGAAPGKARSGKAHAQRRSGRGCGAALPSRRDPRTRTARADPGAARRRKRGMGEQWLLLPGGIWRRVETIRVRSLFG